MFNYMEKIIGNMSFSKKKSIGEIIYKNLRQAIIYGTIPKGERIIECELAEKLSTSRTPLRSALKMLESEDLVEWIPRVGVIVKGISFEDIMEIYKIRQNLEVLATVAAMKNITEDEIKEIQSLLDLADEKNKEGEVEEVLRLFHEFHSKVYDISRMRRLVEMINNLNEYLQRFRDISISNSERREEALREHRDILKAIVKKDKEEVTLLVNNHLKHSLDTVVRELRDKL